MENLQEYKIENEEHIEQNQNQEKAKQELIKIIQNMSIEELIKFLNERNKTECYYIIRDVMTNYQRKLIKSNEELKIKFKEIENQSKEAFEFSRKSATMGDVMQGFQEVYDRLTNMISRMDNDIKNFYIELEKIKQNNFKENSNG